MKHAILGMGAVGGLVATALGSTDDDVTAIVRHAQFSAALFTLERPSDERLTATIRVAEFLKKSDGTDVLWIATKAHDLNDALFRVAGDCAEFVVPLLNGIEHVPYLRRRFGAHRIVPASIAVEAERVAPNIFRQNSPFVRLALPEYARGSPAPAIRKLERLGFEISFETNEETLLWKKLAFLAPFALTTSISRLTAGSIREDARWRDAFSQIAEEVTAVGRAAGAEVTAQAAITMLDRVAPAMTSSMSRDIEAGRKTEIDAIAGAVIRTAQRLGPDVPVLREFRDRLAVAGRT